MASQQVKIGICGLHYHPSDPLLFLGFCFSNLYSLISFYSSSLYTFNLLIHCGFENFHVPKIDQLLCVYGAFPDCCSLFHLLSPSIVIMCSFKDSHACSHYSLHSHSLHLSIVVILHVNDMCVATPNHQG